MSGCEARNCTPRTPATGDTTTVSVRGFSGHTLVYKVHKTSPQIFCRPAVPNSECQCLPVVGFLLKVVKLQCSLPFLCLARFIADPGAGGGPGAPHRTAGLRQRPLPSRPGDRGRAHVVSFNVPVLRRIMTSVCVNFTDFFAEFESKREHWLTKDCPHCCTRECREYQYRAMRFAAGRSCRRNWRFSAAPDSPKTTSQTRAPHTSR